MSAALPIFSVQNVSIPANGGGAVQVEIGFGQIAWLLLPTGAVGENIKVERFAVATLLDDYTTAYTLEGITVPLLDVNLAGARITRIDVTNETAAAPARSALLLVANSGQRTGQM